MQTDTTPLRSPNDDSSSLPLSHGTPVLSKVVPKSPAAPKTSTGDASPREQVPEPAEARHHESRFPRFPYEDFASSLDPAVVKARYQVGPIDPAILFIGDLDDRHGPDLLLRAMPTLLKKYPQARLVIVGDGPLLWPLRVMSRYMMLDYAVRVVGHLGGAEARELVAAADIVVVPSRVQTEDWQILAGWSARKPVIATREVADPLCRNEHDGLLIQPTPASCAQVLERVLGDAELGRRIGERGHHNLAGNR